MDYIIWNFSLTDKPRMSHTLTLRSITVLKKYKYNTFRTEIYSFGIMWYISPPPPAVGRLDVQNAAFTNQYGQIIIRTFLIYIGAHQASHVHYNRLSE